MSTTPAPRASDAIIVPERITPKPADAESLDVWGFQDTRFAIDGDGNAEVLGNRYELSGQKLTRLMPWIRDTLGIDISASDVFRSQYPIAIPPPVANAGFCTAIRDFLREDQVTLDGELRLRHGHGQTQEEMFAIKYGSVARVPDLIVYPETQEQVEKLVVCAEAHGVSLVPYGGGTNVTDALRCDEEEPRAIVSVEMRRMNRILWIDRVNLTACIEAGAVGRDIQAQLAAYGFTMGHEPDSIEFSTLGGWIATNASGMKKNKYGNIEDLVLDMTVVTANGVLSRTAASPRESVGLDWRRMMFGSEGTLGIVTSAVVKLFPLPEVQEYGSLLFPTFEDGCGFMQELARTPSVPASVRLVDNLQFQFGQALKPASTGWKVYKSRLEKFFVLNVKGFDAGKMVACTLVFEGTREEVAQQQKAVTALGAKYKGMAAGSENGRRGYQLTYGIAYIRDFLMNYYIIAESFETSAAWSDVLPLIRNVKKKLEEEYARRKLPGAPFITARVTQLYRTGAAIYFYFGFYFKGVANPSHVYLELENIAREEILRSGGSLSHHHGVGKLRRHFLPSIMSDTALAWKRSVKAATDPKNIFGVGNQGL
jgi:alkyldihydroxyacetonephosphate synthase